MAGSEPSDSGAAAGAAQAPSNAASPGPKGPATPGRGASAAASTVSGWSSRRAAVSDATTADLLNWHMQQMEAEKRAGPAKRRQKLQAEQRSFYVGAANALGIVAALIAAALLQVGC